MADDSISSSEGDRDAKRRIADEVSALRRIGAHSPTSSAWSYSSPSAAEEDEERGFDLEAYKRRREAEERRWMTISVPLMIAIAGAIITFQDRFFRWSVHHMWIALIVFVGGLALLAIRNWWQDRPGRVSRAWAIFLFVGLVWFGSKAVLDAHDREWADCWTFSREKTAAGEITMRECAPGSTPPHGTRFNQDSGSGSSQYCEHVNTSSSGGTIWRCVYEQF
jgi:hypothetical protein